MGFFSAVGGMFVVEAANLFQKRYPDCDVEIRESQFRDGIGQQLHGGQLDALLCVLPAAADPGLTTSPVLFREACLLAVSARHRLAHRTSVSLADADTVLLEDPHVPDYWAEVLVPHRPAGVRPANRGPVFGTAQEMLALVGAAKGVFPVPAQAPRYYSRPDIVFVPVHDAPPFEWILAWPNTAHTARVQAFTRAAQDLAQAGWSPDGQPS